MKRLRLSIAGVFFAHGILVASWVPHIPHVKNSLDIGDGTLGIVLLFLAAGAFAAMLLTGGIAATVGADVVTRWSTIAVALTLIPPFLARSPVTLALTLALFGASFGTMDVAMNAVAADFESRRRRPTMSSFHAMFSVGALSGALLASTMIGLEIEPLVQVLIVATGTILCVTPALRSIESSSRTVASRPRITLPRGRLLTIGLLALAVMLAEGSAHDWSAVYMSDSLGTSGSMAALGFAGFSIAMAIGRFTGDRINQLLGPAQLTRLGTATAAIGLGVGLAINEPGSVIAGFTILGLGLSNVVPVVFTAAASEAPTSAQGISSVATISYLGFLAGPPLIGGIAEITSLTVGLYVVVGLIAAASLMAGALEGRPAEEIRA